MQVVREIEADSLGSAYGGSSLETVVGSIAEQRQRFNGADHALLWAGSARWVSRTLRGRMSGGGSVGCAHWAYRSSLCAPATIKG